MGFYLTLQNWIFLGRLARGQLQDLRDEVLAAELPQVGFLICLGKMEEVLGLIVLQAALIQEELGDLLRVQLIAGGGIGTVEDVSYTGAGPLSLT